LIFWEGERTRGRWEREREREKGEGGLTYFFFVFLVICSEKGSLWLLNSLQVSPGRNKKYKFTSTYESDFLDIDILTSAEDEYWKQAWDISPPSKP